VITAARHHQDDPSRDWLPPMKLARRASAFSLRRES
jgi:hypothetical protein